MIVEADPAFRHNLAQRLTTDERRIFLADRPSEVQKIVRRQKIDVVVLSLNALRREGLAILKNIRKVRPLIEVIIINTADQIALSIEGMHLGAFDDFIVPLDIDALSNRIHEAFLQKCRKQPPRKSLLRRYQDAMISATFAEAGEPDTARAYLQSQEKNQIKIPPAKGAKDGED